MNGKRHTATLGSVTMTLGNYNRLICYSRTRTRSLSSAEASECVRAGELRVFLRLNHVFFKIFVFDQDDTTQQQQCIKKTER